VFATQNKPHKVFQRNLPYLFSSFNNLSSINSAHFTHQYKAAKGVNIAEVAQLPKFIIESTPLDVFSIIVLAIQAE